MHYKKRPLSYFVSLSCSSVMALSPLSFAQNNERNTGIFLEEVLIVSSTRTDTKVANTAASVTALSSDTLTAAGITDPTSLQDLATNISVDLAASNGLQITIRGVSSADNSEKGDPSAAFLQDGIYIARPQAHQVSFFDLEQVEILRGPQGTLYGRNATAGLINVISAKPTMSETYGSIDGTFGDYNQTQATGMLNISTSESSAIRVAVNIDKRDTYLNKFPDSLFSLGEGKDNQSFRLSGLFDLNDDINLLVRADHSAIKGNGRNAVKLSNFFDVSTLAPSDSGRGVNPTYIGGSNSSDELRTVGWSDNQRDNYDNSTWGLMSELNWSISDALTMTYLNSYRELKRVETKVTGLLGSIGDFNVTANTDLKGDYEQNSHELRFTYKTDTMNLQTGLYYFQEESDIEYLLFGVQAPNPGDDGYVYGFTQDPTTSESFAIFAQGAFDLNDKLTLTLGVRQTEDKKSRLGATISHANLGEDFNFTQDPISNPTPDSLNNAKVSYSELTWKTGLDYNLSDNTLVYATISTGYKAGGFNDGCVESNLNCNGTSIRSEDTLFYNPETLIAYEAGLKTDLENGLQTFISVFNYDYQDLQLSALSDCGGAPCQVTSNAGEADVTGIELESQYRINLRNKLNVALTWLDAKYTDYQLNTTTNFKGDSLNRSPEFTAIVGYQHITPLNSGAEIVVNTNFRWSDEYTILTTALSAQFVQPSFSKTDFSIAYYSPNDNWHVQGFIKNIEDEVTIANAAMAPVFPTFEDGTVNVSAPRTAGVRFGIKF